MKIAIVLTVKNEIRILRDNLLYHNAIGVDKAYVYFDNTTDSGKESIADLDFVVSKNSVSVDGYSHLEYLEKFTSQAKEHHTARQCLNTFDAQQQSKQDGVDWLISIDADELVCTDFYKSSSLKPFFTTIPLNIDIVMFKTVEALQSKMAYKNVFSEEVLFKANSKAYKKTFENPFNNSKMQFSWWYGQTMGKAAIRINQDIIPHNVHRYKKISGEKPITITKGNLLHFHCYDAEDFIKKFTNFSDRPDTFLSGNKVDSIKLLLRDIVNKASLSKLELIDYYKRNIIFSEAEIEKYKKGRRYLFLKIKPQPLQQITSVAKTFNEIIYKS